MEVKEPAAQYLSPTKQTELGELPRDWAYCNLGDVTDILTGHPFPSSGYSDSGTRLLRGSNVKRGRIEWQEELTEYWPTVTPDIKKYLLNAGDVVVAMDGSLVGRSFGSLKNADLPALLLQRVARVRSNKVNIGYLTHWVCSERFTTHCDAVKTTTAIPHISPGDIRSFKVALPPTQEEQRRIAAAFDDTNALIDSLEQLLTKKRQIKQGAMQELLTGKRRLLRDAPEWRDSTLGQLGRWFGGMTPSMARTDYWAPQDLPWLSSGDIKVSRLMESTKSVSVRAVTDGATTVAPARSLVVVMRSGILRKYFPVAMTLRPMAINQDLKALAPSPEVLPEYLLHALTYCGESILASCLKAGTTVESIEFGWLKQFAIQLPSEQEQKAIAEALTAIDLEIDAIEARLVKSRALKQAMAQALLTGRIRLVESTT